MVFEDRVAKYPGRWTIVKSDGTSEVVTLVRNDEPTVEGTPINAATLNELSTVAGAINAKEESISAAQATASERAKAEQAAANAAENEKNAKASETESAKNLQGTKEYFEQVRTITIGAQGWYATPEALKAAVPVGENGWWAVVGTTDTIWTWDGDTGAWVDTRKEVDLSDYPTQDQIKKLLEQYMPLRPATAAVLGGIKVGDNLSIDSDGTVSLTGENVTKALTYTPAPKDEVTQVTPGLMSAADKKKLDGLDSTGAIAASGNGYIRFSDGTQICWNTARLRSSFGNYVFTFPVPFINTTYAVAGFKADRISDTNYNNFCYYTKKTGQVEIDNAHNGYNDNLYSTLIVIGRWK